MWRPVCVASSWQAGLFKVPARARHDVVIVGGGHNGLVAAAYLAKQGLETVVLERRELLGNTSVMLFEHMFRIADDLQAVQR